AVVEVGHAQTRAEGEGTMRCGQCLRGEGLATGRASAGEALAVIGSFALLIYRGLRGEVARSRHVRVRLGNRRGDGLRLRRVERGRCRGLCLHAAGHETCYKQACQKYMSGGEKTGNP